MQVRPPVVPPPPDALPEPEIYVRLCEAMELFGPPPAELDALAAQRARRPRARWPSSAPRRRRQRRPARDAGVGVPHARPAPAGAVAHGAVLHRPPERHVPHRERAAHARPGLGGQDALRDRHRALPPHPRASRGRRDRAPAPGDQPRGPPRLRRPQGPPRARADAARDPPRHRDASRPIDAAFPLVMAAGLRTRWTANTIQRDPALAQGQGAALRAQPLARRRGDARRPRRRRGARRDAARQPHAAGAGRREAHGRATSGCRTASAWCRPTAWCRAATRTS